MSVDEERHPPAADELARRCAARIAALDRPLRALGIEVEEVGPGCARGRMQVRPDMLNAHATCHGGVIFSLADCMFAIASNSRGRSAVAAGCSIEYLAPVQVGAVLVAVAAERSLRGRSGVYDVTVSDATGAAVALFRGRSRVHAEQTATAGGRAPEETTNEQGQR